MGTSQPSSPAVKCFARLAPVGTLSPVFLGYWVRESQKAVIVALTGFKLCCLGPASLGRISQYVQGHIMVGFTCFYFNTGIISACKVVHIAEDSSCFSWHNRINTLQSMIYMFIYSSVARSKSWLCVCQDKHILHPIPLLFILSAEQGRATALQLGTKCKERGNVHVQRKKKRHVCQSNFCMWRHPAKNR